MVYVEKIKVKGKTYFKLVHTIRKGNKVLHKSSYLGKTLPSKARLNHLKEEFLKKLHTGRYFSENEINEIEKVKSSYNREIKRLSSLEKEKKLKEFIIRFTYDSSKLSGVAITLRQTSLILKEGIMPKDLKSLKTVKEIENHEKGIIAITKYKSTLNLRFIKKLHLILF